MDNRRLQLVNEQNLSTIVLLNTGVLSAVETEVTLQIAEIREPENGVGSRSIATELPGTDEINAFFENAFSVNVQLSTFNPNLKVRATYYKDEVEIFDGYLQLLSITHDKGVVYKINILGEVLTLFTVIKDKPLTALYNYPTTMSTVYLPLSIYNHTLTASNIDKGGTWVPLTEGIGYVYPMLDRGQAGNWAQYNGLTIEQWSANGCFFVYTYLVRIFEQAGFTFTSNFFNSSFFKKLILTPTKFPSLSQTVLNNNKFLANPATNQVLNKTLSNSDPIFTFSQSLDTVNYGSEVYDAGNVFNNPNYTPALNKKYNLKADFIFDVQILDASNNDISANYQVINGTVQIYFGTGTNSVPLSSLILGVNGNNSLSGEMINQPLIAFSTHNVKIALSNITLFKNSGANAATLRVTIKSGSFSSELADTLPYVNMPIDALDMIPEDYTQLDLLSDLRKMFNLYFSIDKSNPKNIIVEPRDDFYLNTAKDWTYKHDDTAGVEIFPTGQVDNLKYTFKHSEDGDYFSEKYREVWKENYGTHTELIENDFIKSESVIETKASSTHLVGNDYSNGMVVSTMRTQDEFTIKPFKSKTRILYYAGLIGSSNNAKPISFNFNNATYNTYPYAGHLDNPFNPTIDIQFGLPKYVYYIKPNQTLTSNYLYNKYYSRYINQIKDKNSKIVRTRFNLNAHDIATFDFRNPIFTFIKGEPGYYLVNYVKFNPLSDESAEVELLKLTDYPIHTPVAVEYNGGLPNTDVGTQRVVNPINISEDSNNWGENSFLVGGKENTIEQGAKNVSLVNCENVIVQNGVENFTAVNLKNAVIDDSYNGKTITGNEAPILIDSDTTLDQTYNGKTIYVDASAVNVTLTWDTQNMEGAEVTVIRQDAGANDIYIDAISFSGTENYMGAGLPASLGLSQYQRVRLTSISDTIIG